MSAVIGRSAQDVVFIALCAPWESQQRARALLIFSMLLSARAVRCFHQAAKTFLILAPCGEQRRPWTVRSPPSSRLLSPFTPVGRATACSLSLGLAGLPLPQPADRSRSSARRVLLHAINVIFTHTEQPKHMMCRSVHVSPLRNVFHEALGRRRKF